MTRRLAGYYRRSRALFRLGRLRDFRGRQTDHCCGSCDICSRQLRSGLMDADILRKACRCTRKDQIKDWSGRNYPELHLRWDMVTEYAVEVTDGVVT